MGINAGALLINSPLLPLSWSYLQSSDNCSPIRSRYHCSYSSRLTHNQSEVQKISDWDIQWKCDPSNACKCLWHRPVSSNITLLVPITIGHPQSSALFQLQQIVPQNLLRWALNGFQCNEFEGHHRLKGEFWPHWTNMVRCRTPLVCGIQSWRQDHFSQSTQLVFSFLPHGKSEWPLQCW